MAKAQRHETTIFEDAGWTAIARVQNPSGNNITQATITTVELVVTMAYEDGTTATTLAQNTLTKTAVVFDTLQTGDARWTKDTTGFNFLYEVPATAFPKPGRATIEFKFTPTSGAAYFVVWTGPVIGVSEFT